MRYTMERIRWVSIGLSSGLFYGLGRALDLDPVRVVGMAGIIVGVVGVASSFLGEWTWRRRQGPQR